MRSAIRAQPIRPSPVAMTGLKNGDVITASYSTTATFGSAPGNYPITATLNDPGNRLGNYQVTNTPGTLKVFNSCGISAVPFFATQGAVGGYWLYYQPLTASPVGLYTFSLFAGTLPPGLHHREQLWAIHVARRTDDARDVYLHVAGETDGQHV